MRGRSDRTALDGNYDVDLRFSPGSGAAPSPNVDPLTSRDDGPSIFTAVQEQLGLKLSPTKAPLDVLVIDHIERPDPD
jgi:uncharacterized protein (TIGR03435 family)